MKIFDLDDPPIFTKDLQKNILIIKKNFGEQFIIKNDGLELPAKLYLVTYEFNKKLTYYSLVYDTQDRTDWLFPFKISFFDDILFKKNNNCNIDNIHRTEKITGTNMVNTILKLLKLIHAEKVTLFDGAELNCGNIPVKLSFFKLLEKGTTFYQKFGFHFAEFNLMTQRLKKEYDTVDKMTKVLNENLKAIRKIKLKYYISAYKEILNIVKDVVSEQDYDNITIYLYHPTKPYIINKTNNRPKILSIFNEIDTLLRILENSKRTYLVETMKDLFYTNCMDYANLTDLIFHNMIVEIRYKKKHIKLKHGDLFPILFDITNNSLEIDLN